MSIQRTVRRRAGGFQVRVFRNRKVITRFFAFKKYGGEKNAYKLAVETEERLERLYPVFPSRKKGDYADRPNRNSTTGVVGVRAFIVNTPKRRPTIQFGTRWVKGGIQRSSAAYGILGALSMVLEARENATGIKMPSVREAWGIIKRNKGW